MSKVLEQQNKMCVENWYIDRSQYSHLICTLYLIGLILLIIYLFDHLGLFHQTNRFDAFDIFYISIYFIKQMDVLDPIDLLDIFYLFD